MTRPLAAIDNRRRRQSAWERLAHARDGTELAAPRGSGKCDVPSSSERSARTRRRWQLSARCGACRQVRQGLSSADKTVDAVRRLHRLLKVVPKRKPTRGQRLSRPIPAGPMLIDRTNVIDGSRGRSVEGNRSLTSELLGPARCGARQSGEFDAHGLGVGCSS
jgi:hypothetical protein